MTEPLRVAVVGAGPAGIYASNILQNRASELGIETQIDLIESLPAPYGLIRYGVAPDHPRIKGIVNSLHEMLSSESIRLIGNTHVGKDISLDELRSLYHAVIFATGAQADAPSSLPGASIPGSFGAADFVSWYDGHPDVPREWPLDAEEIAVLGNGNVALDVARVLAKQPHDMLTTDIPENVYNGLRASAARDIHLFGRRGPSQIKFTPIELRELGEVPGVDIVLDEADFTRADAESEPAMPGNQAKIMARILQSWRERSTTGAARRLHLHFWHNPIEILGKDRVSGIRFERTRLGVNGTLENTGETVDYHVQAVYRAIGYHGSPVHEVPFDDVAGVIPNDGGRVIDTAGRWDGLYVTGWIKRGPVGLIGHTKSDASETIENLLADYRDVTLPERPGSQAVLALLSQRNVRFTSWEGWLSLDAYERSQGEQFVGEVHRERIKVVDRDEQVDLSTAQSVSV